MHGNRSPTGRVPSSARDPRRCHYIACVAAPCICPPGARAKMPSYSCTNPKEDPMNADVLTTKVADGIAVITLGSARRIYFDGEMGDVLTEALDRFAGDTSIRVVVITGGAP